MSSAKNVVPQRRALVSWLCGVALGIFPVLLIPLVIQDAHEIFLSSVASSWLEIYLFLGAGYLLFFKRGSANIRLTVEVTIWLATANYLIFKHFEGPLSYVLAPLAIIASFVIAYRRAETYT